MKKIMFFCLGLLFVSCVKDVNFGQIKQLELEPVYVASLLNYDFNQTYLLAEISKSKTDVEFVNHYAFSFTERINLQGKLEKVVLEFEFNNPFNKAFDLEFFFFDTAGNETYPPFTINVPKNIKGFKFQKEIAILSNKAILSTTALKTKTRLLASPDNLIATNSEKFSYKLGGTFYLKVRL